MDSREKQKHINNYEKETRTISPWASKNAIAAGFARIGGDMSKPTIVSYENAVKRFASYCQACGKRKPDALDVKAYFADRVADGVSQRTLEAVEYPGLKKYSAILGAQGGA